MKRWMKKAVAFGLALSVFAGCMVVNAEEETSTITLVEEAVYDEAVSFLDTVVLLENGHWAKMVKNEATGQREPYSDVTSDTNIVFIDGAGNKKVISNKDANGEQIFDAVHPEITNLDSNDYICVLKDGKKAYISPEGEYFGENLRFYKDVKYAGENYLWVSDDGTDYDLINKSGEVVYTANGYQSGLHIGDYIYVANTDNVEVIRESDMKVVKEYPNASYFTKITDEYVMVNSAEGKVVLNAEAEEVLQGKSVKYCYGVDYSNEYLLVECNTDTGSSTYELVNMETEESVYTFESYPEIYSDGYVLDRDGKFFASIDGSIQLDLNEYIERLLCDHDMDQCDDIRLEYANGVLFVSAKTYSMSATSLYAEESGFNKLLAGVSGAVDYVDGEKESFLTENSSGKTIGVYSFKGQLLAKHSFESYSSFSSNDNALPNMPNVLTTASVKTEHYNTVSINTDGSISNLYETFKESDRFLFGGTKDGKLEVINGAGDVVYSGAGEYEPKVYEEGFIQIKFIRNAFGLKNNNYFVILKDDACNLYNVNGAKMETVKGYSAIGPCGAISGSYKTEEGSSLGYYCYSNDDLANGLCVTRKTDADGNYKYGVIKFNNVIQKGDCNGDMVVNAQDALAVLKHAAKISLLTDESIAEVTGDGQINAEDALKILKYAARIIDSLE